VIAESVRSPHASKGRAGGSFWSYAVGDRSKLRDADGTQRGRVAEHGTGRTTGSVSLEHDELDRARGRRDG
jgi:hypothetical protein